MLTPFRFFTPANKNSADLWILTNSVNLSSHVHTLRANAQLGRESERPLGRGALGWKRNVEEGPV